VYDYTEWSSAMPTARIFTNGNSQAVRLPKEFRFNEDEVVIKKVGDMVILFPKRYDAAALKALLAGLDEDFSIEREQPEAIEERNFD
jgi:antitoxin VapB